MSDLLRKPSFYAALLAIAALANAGGYLLNLWHDETVFDEVVHLFTSFAVIAAIGRFLIVTDLASASARLAVSLTVLALALGVAWEFFEWLIGIIGGRHDTLMDLAMDTSGGALAAVLVLSASRKH